jgi:chromatin remodeling complex protein RSC6
MTKDTAKKTVVKKKIVKKKVVKEVEDPVVNTESVPEVVPETPTDTVTTASTTDISSETSGDAPDISQNFKELLDKLSNSLSDVKTLMTEVKKLEKRVNREFKEVQKKNKKKGGSKNSDKPKRAPSGFAKPSSISEDLSTFLGKESGVQMARTEVTKHITQYIKDHGLQNPTNKRHILPDTKLKALLNVQEGDQVTYFNLQKFMKHHFPKPVTASVTPSVSS